MTATTREASEPFTLTVEEIAQRLRINRRTVYRMIERGQLRAVRAGRLWRVPMDSLQDYLRGRVPTRDNGNQQADP